MLRILFLLTLNECPFDCSLLSSLKVCRAFNDDRSDHSSKNVKKIWTSIGEVLTGFQDTQNSIHECSYPSPNIAPNHIPKHRMKLDRYFGPKGLLNTRSDKKWQPVNTKQFHLSHRYRYNVIIFKSQFKT